MVVGEIQEGILRVIPNLIQGDNSGLRLHFVKLDIIFECLTDTAWARGTTAELACRWAAWQNYISQRNVVSNLNCYAAH